MSDYEQDEGLIQEFIAEGREHLEAIEPDLLQLESSGEQAEKEIVNRIFRAIHSIKGASGFFGFEKLKNLSHVMESVLMLIREGQMAPRPVVVGPLLQGVDKLRLMLNDIHNSESVPCDDLIPTLQHFIDHPNAALSETTPQLAPGQSEVALTAPEAEHPATEPSPEGPMHWWQAKHPEQAYFSPSEESVRTALQQGKFLYDVKVHWEKHFQSESERLAGFVKNLHSLGTVLGANVSLEQLTESGASPPESPEIHVLFGTVLEVDLIATALGLPGAEATLVEKPASGKTSAHTQESESGGSSTVVSQQTAPAAMAAEKRLGDKVPTPSAASSSNEASDTIRVRVELLNRLMDLAGEMVLSRNQLIRASNKEHFDADNLSRIIQNIDLITSNLQEHIMQTRMQPVETVFRKFPRVVRDMASALGKEIRLEMSGQEVELDKSILENLSDPLTHLIRNCCDHGIEKPDERARMGKPKTGAIRLHAFHEGGQINLLISDDGKGIDPAKLGLKALEKGLITEAELNRMTPQEVVNLIFLPGFSTAEKVTDISGRGVGMDVVRSNIEKMGGHISIETTPGQGTNLLLQLPLTLAIIPSLVVGVGEHRFAIPQMNLVELVRVRASEIAQKVERVGTAAVLRLRGKLLPLVRLADVLSIPREFTDPKSGEKRPDRRRMLHDQRLEMEMLPPDALDNRRQKFDSDYNILVLKVGNNQYGLIVDQVFDTEEIVVKPLSGYLKRCKTYAGTTIMGDGKVAMILDVGGISSTAKLNFADIDAEEERRQQRREDLENLSGEARRTRQSVILFTNNEDEIFALPLSSLLRLEKFNPDSIEQVGHREFITYRGRSLPLVRLEDYMSVRPAPADLSEAFFIIPKEGGGCAGIFASRILDTIETDVALDTHLIEATEVSGSAVINGHLTLFVNAERLLIRANVISPSGLAHHNNNNNNNGRTLEVAGYGY
jgi:two-component system chemotaxis sensor kinase CheA